MQADREVYHNRPEQNRLVLFVDRRTQLISYKTKKGKNLEKTDDESRLEETNQTKSEYEKNKFIILGFTRVFELTEDDRELMYLL